MIVTPRDRALLQHLSNYGMLATKHIKNLIFGGAATTTVLRRLRILETHKLIDRLHGLESKEVLWILTSKGAYIGDVEPVKIHWNKNHLEHDFKLLELRLEMEKLEIAKTWIPEHEIRHQIFKNNDVKEAKNKLVPDGIMITRTQEKEVSVAVELELNLKSKERIKEILNRYRQKKDINYLWYICQTPSIGKSILDVWKALASTQTTMKLCYSLAEDVWKNRLEARIFNQAASVTLAQLWHPSRPDTPAHHHAQDVSTQQAPRLLTPRAISANNCTILQLSQAPPDSCLHH